MAQRSRQKQCPTCGLWVIWSPTGEELGYKSDTIYCIRMGRLWRRKKASP